MAIIPTFNNLDLMENIRKGSLNPTITAVNELVAKSATLPKFVGSFKDNELARWDTATGSFEPSGVLANRGELFMSPNTLYFGNHSMSSGVENVLFKNLFTGKSYAPVWQSVDPGSNTAAIRGYGTNQTDVKIPKGDIDVTNPINKGVVTQNDWSFNGLVFWLSEYTLGVVIEVYNSSDGTLVYRHAAGDRIGLRASADMADGAYLQAHSYGTPMVQVDIKFKEPELPSLTTATWTRLINRDQRVYDFNKVGKDTITLLGVGATANSRIASLEVFESTGNVTNNIPIAHYSYDKGQDSLTVNLSSKVDSGYVLVEFWGN